jgi:hypothetical protein
MFSAWVYLRVVGMANPKKWVLARLEGVRFFAGVALLAPEGIPLEPEEALLTGGRLRLVLHHEVMGARKRAA